ncbi:MAG TPA: hypothetical protein VNR11_02260 [Xanthobacteraceae bacterium]|nr:hypothetical protein [Xanthobacteraceae bacterium]
MTWSADDDDGQIKLGRLEPGDVFHAASPGGTPLICLVLAVSDIEIRARDITSQHALTFTRDTGEQIVAEGEVGSTIRSVEPLPAEHHATLLAFECKYRLGEGEDRFQLTPAERTTVRFLAQHYGCGGDILRIWELPA